MRIIVTLSCAFWRYVTKVCHSTARTLRQGVPPLRLTGDARDEGWGVDDPQRTSESLSKSWIRWTDRVRERKTDKESEMYTDGQGQRSVMKLRTDWTSAVSSGQWSVSHSGSRTSQRCHDRPAPCLMAVHWTQPYTVPRYHQVDYYQYSL